MAARHPLRESGPDLDPGQPVGQEDVDQLGLAGDTDRQRGCEGHPRAGRAALAVSERQPGGDERRLPSGDAVAVLRGSRGRPGKDDPPALARLGRAASRALIHVC